mmetsp:Transcript_18053/g.50530  ORF Transcript_18053/g.50530 Transcript_18053/m.50530 type:complete len:412 (+) Transcript_18053:176-1411(+)
MAGCLRAFQKCQSTQPAACSLHSPAPRLHRVNIACLAKPEQGSTGAGAAAQRNATPAIVGLKSSSSTEARKLVPCRTASSSSAGVSTAGGGGSSGINDSAGGGGGGGGGGGDGKGQPSGGQPMDPKIAAILAAAGRTAESFPPDFAGALLAGRVTPEILKRFLELESNFFIKLVWGIQGFRERLLGDPSFPVKVAIECGIGVCTKLTAEKAKRQENFSAEIDFVAANVIMAIIADFMLTWLPAPTLSYAPKKVSSNKILDFFANCPDNAFQKVRPGTDPFSLGQRFGAIARNGLKLLGVGFFASLLGVGMTNGLIGLRQVLDPSFLPPNPAQDVLGTSATYGVYMAVSSNLRYQVIAGVIEERGIETLLAGQPQLCHVLSLILRTGNTFLGSLLWVDFVRLLGMQTSGGGH